MSKQHTDQPTEEQALPALTADEVFEIARRGALVALEAAGMISKKDKAMAIVNGSLPPNTVITANALKSTPPLPKASTAKPATPVEEPTEEQKAAANKWAKRVHELDPQNLNEWDRHRLQLRDGLPGISDAIKKQMFRNMLTVAHRKWIDYDFDTKKFSPAVVTAQGGETATEHANPLA
ncbi:hypothetical protein A6C57_00040 [Fibrella sp. ES10-3-2-2]|nr:hypothetical protein A6C57_00040 [Fibrella sp. ES10-3-2-2]